MIGRRKFDHIIRVLKENGCDSQMFTWLLWRPEASRSSRKITFGTRCPWSYRARHYANLKPPFFLRVCRPKIVLLTYVALVLVLEVEMWKSLFNACDLPSPPLIKFAINTRPCTKLGGTTMNEGKGGVSIIFHRREWLAAIWSKKGPYFVGVSQPFFFLNYELLFKS